MSESVTKQEVEEIVGRAVDKAVTDLSEIISTFAQQVDARFNTLETKVDALEIKVDKLEKKVDRLEKQVNALDMKVANIESHLERVEKEVIDLRESHLRLLTTIDGFVARIDHYETEQRMRDNQFKRLLEWAHKVSEKTGIPLENL